MNTKKCPRRTREAKHIGGLHTGIDGHRMGYIDRQKEIG